MKPAVKPPRRYVAPRRAEAAAATRQAILDAAGRLFERDGYVATAMPAIAAEARVAVKTVYLAYGSKPDLLRTVWDQRLAGEESAIPVLERRWFQELTTAPSPAEKLRRFAAQSCAAKSRSGHLLEVIRNASAVDADLHALWREIEAKLLTVARGLAEQLDAAEGLRAGLSTSAATDAIFALSHPSMWHLVVVQRGWTDDAYAAWLERSLEAELLRQPEASSIRRCPSDTAIG